MPRRRLTRRQTLQAGAAALAAGVLRPPGVALGSPAALFELPIDGGGGAFAASAGWRRTEVLAAPRRFDMIGLRWGRGGTLEAEVRARRRGGRWSRWTPLPFSPSHAPDGRRPNGTEPAWTGAADLFQLRLRGSARDLRARFVRAQPAARLAGRSASGPRARVSARSSTSGPPAVIPRAAWGAGAVPPRDAPAYGRVELAFVHHTATANAYGPADSAGIVLGIARYHRDSNGWNDIGYNFLVDRFGQVFEGRAGGIDQPVVGAQAQGYNSVSCGIACIGDFGAIAQSPAAMETLARLIGWKLSLHGVPVQGQVTVTSAGGTSNRYRGGTPVVFERISGHRDANSTSCPGAALYAQLPGLRARAADFARPYSRLTVETARTRVRHPARTRLSGRLERADGGSAAGQAVQLELRPEGREDWLALGAAGTTSDGSFAAEVALPGSGAVRATWAGDGAHGPLASASRSVTVVGRLSLGLSTRRLRAGRVVEVSGTATPDPLSGRVVVVVERRHRGKWLAVRTRRLRARDGAYRMRLRLRTRGLYRVSAAANGVVRRRTVRAISR